jgi:RecQ family ATP-dependent DNA helicase
MNEILKKYFGYDKLKDKQEQIVKSILDKNDTIGILATGYGKSICYQLPYLIQKKSVIIISPLISLMQDQQTKLESLNIPVYCLNSNNSNKQNDKYNLLNGETGIIYISPEYLFNSKEFIINMSKKNLISLIAIDESHCISTWGDFRPEYKELGVLKDWASDVPLLALTATATPKIISDITKVLKLDRPNVFMSSFYRENLNINVIKKLNQKYDLNKIVDLIKQVDSDDKIIIYCKTKDETDNFVLKLEEFGIKSKSYHAGKSNEKRNKIQKKFMKGKINIIIATIAFGMGIDLPNIRLIINYGISKDMESFYQEIGRAGRDGKTSNIYVYWSNNDFNINKSFLNNIKDLDFQKRQMERILEMEKFVNSNTCRMKYITKYFGEDMDDCGHCDNCLSNKKEEKKDITKECYYILKLIKNLQNNFGTTMLCDILAGSTSKKINSIIKNMSTFGKLSSTKKDTIKEIIRYLIVNEYLMEVKIENSFGSVIKLNAKGQEWITSNKKLKKIEDKIYQMKLISQNNELVDLPDDFENRLKEYRKKKADESNVQLYQIFPNKTITSLLSVKVKDINDFEKIDSFGKTRIEKYGNDILKMINNN